MPALSTTFTHISHASLLSLLIIAASKNALPSRLRVHFAWSIVQSPAVMRPQVNQQEPAPVQTACVVAGACALADAGVTKMLPIASKSIVTIIGIRRRDAIIMACMMIPFCRMLKDSFRGYSMPAKGHRLSAYSFADGARRAV
jgi:hypothetical protein